MRAACYARYSSDLQRETSIDDQLAVARAYAHTHAWGVLDDHVYSDAGISGASLEGRPGIQALLAAAARIPPPFFVVLVDDTSRVARDLRDALHVLRVLRFAGIRTIYISQQIDSDNEQAETLLTVHGLVDGLYLQEMAKKIKRGIAGQLDRGFHTGGKTYGYRSVPVQDPSGRRDAEGPVIIGKRLDVDPDQAGVIRQIFRWYADGVSHPKIIDRLNMSGVPTPRETRWTKHHADRILRNERYLGKQIWGQYTNERRPGTNRRVSRKQPRDTWHIVDRPELRIVDDELWHRVAARRAAIRRSVKIRPAGGLARGRSGLYSKYLLVGLGECGTCGRGFAIASSGAGSPRYGCLNSQHNGTDACANRLTVMVKIVDPLVLKRLQEALLTRAMVKTITDAVAAEVTKGLHAQPSERAVLETRREATEKKLANLVEAIENGVALPSVAQTIATRESELRQINDDLAARAQSVDVDVAVIPTWVRQQLQDLSGLLAENPVRAKAELHRLNMHFTVTPVRDEGKPFLRVEATGDLAELCGIRDLPSARSKKALRLLPLHLSPGAPSLHRSVPTVCTRLGSRTRRPTAGSPRNSR